MIKLIRRLSLGLLAAGLAFGGSSQISSKMAYAAEETNKIKYESQKEQLILAIVDMPKVISSDAFTNYAKAASKAAYEQAVAEGQAVLDKGKEAKMEELAQATVNINNAKAMIIRDVNDSMAKIQLQKAVDDNKTTINAIRLLMKNSPQKIAKVKDQLLQIIKESEALIQEAEKLL